MEHGHHLTSAARREAARREEVRLQAAKKRQEALIPAVQREVQRAAELEATVGALRRELSEHTLPLEDRKRELVHFVTEKYFALAQAFDAVDESRDGLLHRAEVRKAFLRAGLVLGDRRHEALDALVPPPNTGKVRYKQILELSGVEFLRRRASATDVVIAAQKLRKHLSLFDTAGVGRLESEELVHALRANSPTLRMYLDKDEIERAHREARPFESRAHPGEYDYVAWTDALARADRVPWLLQQRTIRSSLPLITSGNVFFDYKTPQELHRIAAFTNHDGRIVEQLGKDFKAAHTHVGEFH